MLYFACKNVRADLRVRPYVLALILRLMNIGIGGV